MEQKGPDPETDKFVTKIDARGFRKYENMDKLFVPPENYADIKKALEGDKFVFITGSEEYGKTYTAIRLLRDYFDKGYEPIWLKGKTVGERSESLASLLDIEIHLKQRRIIYFEDPFGKTEYDAYDDQVTRNISTIIDIIKGSVDTYVIITSRDKVFKDFERRVAAEIDLERFRKRLTLKKRSFDETKRIEMLLNWAKMLNCEWLKYENLVNLVRDKIMNEDKLPTCLNVEQFSYATTDTGCEPELLDIIEAKSMETARSFALEIKAMSPDKILFLSFLSISDFEFELVKDLYYELAIELRIEKPPHFQEVEEWFEEDKVSVSEGMIGFSHFSFYEAWEYVLDKNGFPSAISIEIFSKVLSYLLKLDGLKKTTEKAIIKYIEYLPSFFVLSLIEDLGRPRARRSIFDSLLMSKKFYDRNTNEILTTEERFLLYCFINQRPNPKITINKKFRWDKVLNSLLRSEMKFRRSISDRLLLAIASSPELLQINTPYYRRIFENLIEFEIKRIVREKYFLATDDLFSRIKSYPSIITIRERFQFQGFEDILYELLFKLDRENFIFVSRSKKLVRSARKLLQKTLYSGGQLGPSKRVVDYINYIVRYMKPYRREDIRTRALAHFHKVKDAFSLKSTKPLRMAAMLVFLASQEFGVKNVARFLYEETGVSNYILSRANRKRYTDLIYGQAEKYSR